MSLNLRFRGPKGPFSLSIDPEIETFGGLLRKVSERSGIARCELLAGFPPSPLSLSPDVVLKDGPLCNGDTLTVKEASELQRHTLSPDTQAVLVPQAPASKGQIAAPDNVPLPDGTVLVRRVIEADNSCLFNAVSYLVERSKRAGELRALVASVVLSDPIEYSDAVLGKDPEEYARWIQKPGRSRAPLCWSVHGFVRTGCLPLQSRGAAASSSASSAGTTTGRSRRSTSDPIVSTYSGRTRGEGEGAGPRPLLSLPRGRLPAAAGTRSGSCCCTTTSITMHWPWRHSRGRGRSWTSRSLKRWDGVGGPSVSGPPTAPSYPGKRRADGLGHASGYGADTAPPRQQAGEVLREAGPSARQR